MAATVVNKPIGRPLSAQAVAEKIGGPARTRTWDQGIMSPLL